jgi:hypothetical protein
MSTGTPDLRPRRRATTRPRPLLLGLLLACLAALLAVLVLGTGGSGPRAELTGACVGQGVPQVLRLSPGDLGRLRAAVARVLPDRVGHLYEEGTIVSSEAWTDADPSGPAVDPGERRAGGYEMRWWAPNGDDLVADVLLFASPRAAERFVQLASAPRCGQSSLVGIASRPPLARNLAWTNPDGVAEADVFLARGSRVYRVADAPAGQVRGQLASPGVSRALRSVDTLACLLPNAHCSSANRDVPA